MKHATKIITRALEQKSTTTKVTRALVTCALMTCALTSAQANILPKTAKLIPPETVLLAEVDNFNRLKQQFEKTNLYKLYKDPAMAAFVNDARAKWHEKMKGEKDYITKTIIDANVLPQGRVALALVFNKRTIDTKEPQVLLITQWGANTSKIKEAVEKQVKKAIEDGLHRKTEDYRGITIVTMIKELPPKKVPDFSSYKPENDNAPPMKTVQPPPEKTSYCFVNDCLIVSEDIDVLKFVIAHIKGATSPTLAGEANYNSTIKAVGPYHDIDFYVNIKQIIKTIIAADTTGKAQSWITNLGFDNVTSAGCAIGLGTSPHSSACAKALLKIEGEKKGICKMLDIESAVLKAPQFVPASTYSAIFLNLNIKKAFSELANILAAFSPQIAAILYMPLLPDSPDGQPGIQLKRDIIEHLGSQIIIAQSTKKPFSTNSAPTDSFVAVAVTNHRSLEKSISFLYSKMIAPNNPDARRELLGRTIYVVDPSALLPALLPSGRTPMQVPAGPNTPQMPRLAFTITDTHLIFAAESTVERVIRTLSSTTIASVASEKWFNNAKSAIPSVVGLAGLEDSTASGELLWWMLKKSGKAENKDRSISIGLGMGSKSGLIPGLMLSQAELFDTGLLPEFNTVRKYFGLSVFYGISTSEGFFFEFKNIDSSGTN